MTTMVPQDVIRAYLNSIMGSGVAPPVSTAPINNISTVESPAAAAVAPTPTPSATLPVDLLQLIAQSTPPKVDKNAEARTAANKAVEGAFGTDYGRTNIASTLLDDTINSILGEQRANATQYLDRGRARGIYNDTGYNAGLSRIGTDAEAGRSKLYSLGSSVIDKYRTDANAVRDKAYNAAATTTADTAFSLDPYINEGNEVIGRANSLASGDLRNSFGGTQLFDFSSLNNRAGQAQGAINARDLDVVGALSARRRANSFGRGLGSQGAF